MSACISEPISWLRLERYRLLELTSSEHAQVEGHLLACAACSACLAQIDARADELPSLPVVVAVRPRRRAHLGRALGFGGLALAAAAALLLILLPRTSELEPPGPRLRIKGGELALSLVRLHQGSTAHAATHFAPDDRFKVQLTCPPDLHGAALVAVFQAGQVFFPLPPHALTDCGNLRGLPGAFSLDGDEPAVVCVVVERAGAIDRRALEQHGLRALPELSVCQQLEPAQ
jgi:hypothetical protein